MLHSDKQPPSIWDALRDRHDYALNAPEQRFQRDLTTGREIGASIVFWPTMNFEKGLLYREPLRNESGGLMRGENGNILTYAPKDNMFAVAYRLGTNVLFKQYFAQYGRAFSVAYNNNRDFRHTLETGNDLLALSQTAKALDNAPVPLVQELRAAMQSPVQDMVTHSIAANRLLTNFTNGQMEVTPANIAHLKRELDGLSTLAKEKAGQMRGLLGMRAFAAQTPDAMPQDLEEFSRPSGFIRDILTQDRVTSMRQSQILLSFAAGLIAEGMVPLSQEQLFIPQDHIYITSKQAIELARFISDTMRQSSYSLNQDAKGRPLIDGLPTGAMLKAQASANGDTAYVPLSEREVNEFSTQLLGHMKHHMGASMERLMSFADEHYADVQQVLLDHPKELRSYHDELKTALADHLPPPAAKAANTDKALTTPWQERVQPQQNTLEKIISLPAKAYKHADQLYAHLTRPESSHEVHKLFSRGIPTYILAFPIGLVSNMLLGFTKRDANWNHIPLTKANWKKHGLGLVVTPDSIKSEVFQLLVYPLVESVGSVGMVELARYPRTLAYNAARKMDDVLMAAVKTSTEQDSELKDALTRLSEHNPTAEVLAEHPEYRKVTEALDGKPAIRTAEDYELLAGFYEAVSERIGQDAAKAFCPFMQQGESFKDALHHVTHAPVSSVSEAGLALAFLRSVTAMNQHAIRWLEYLPEESAQLDHKQLGQLAEYINHQAENAGLSVYDPKTMGASDIAAGELVHRDLKTGTVTRASADDIIRLANLGTEKFRSLMTANKFDAITDGRFADRYIDATEKLLFNQTRFAATANEQTGAAQAATTPNTPQEKAKPWNTAGVALPTQGNSLAEAAQYAVRPEARHQMDKLFWRMLFTRLLYTPINITENMMWKHKIHIDKNAPLPTQMKQFFSSHNVKQSMWQVASFPVAFSYGITALWEFGNYLFSDKHRALEESSVSNQYLSAAIRAGNKADPDAQHQMAEREGTNPALMALQEKPEFARLPEIFAKPEDKRSEQEKQLTQHFFTQAGDALLENANDMLLGKTGKTGDIATQMTQLITQPATDIATATRKLAFAESMLGLNREYAAMLRYFDPKEQLIDSKQLAELSTYIHKQALGAGLVIVDPKKPPRGNTPEGVKAGDLLERTADGSLQPASAETLIRFSNVVGDKLLKTIDAKALDKALHGELAERYLTETDKNTTPGL